MSTSFDPEQIKEAQAKCERGHCYDVADVIREPALTVAEKDRGEGI